MKEQSKRERILDAARSLFVEHGYAGTSMGNIAKQAGVNHSLLFHYFDNKETLWQTVKEAIVQEAQEIGTILPDTNRPLANFIEAVVNNSVRFYTDNRDLARMIHWQRLQQSDTARIGVSRTAATGEWLNAIADYQKRGEIDPACPAEFVLTLLLSVTSSFALDQNELIALPAEREQWMKFCAERLYLALTPRPAKERQPTASGTRG